MNRAWLVAAAVALVAGLAVWLTGAADRQTRSKTGTLGTETARSGSGRGGVEARAVDVDAGGRVRGHIVDREGDAVESGTVVLECLDADDRVTPIPDGVVRIGPEGAFDGPGCRGRVCASLRHPSMIEADPWVLRPGTDNVLEARLLDRLLGLVLDSGREPVAGAQVYVASAGGDTDPTALPAFVSTTTTTDAEGLFSLARVARPPCGACREAAGQCEHDDLELRVADEVIVGSRSPGHRTTERRVPIDQTDMIELELEKALAPIEGQLVDFEGRAYPRAFVLARSQLRPHEQHRAAVEHDRFVLDELGTGRYSLRAIQDGVELAHVDDREAGSHPRLVGSLPANGPDVVVRVVDHERVVAGASVEGGPFSGHKTDAEGIARVEQALPGRYMLRVARPGGKALRHTLVIADGPKRHDERIDLRVLRSIP